MELKYRHTLEIKKVLYQTWHDGESEGSFVRIHKAKEGYYGAEWQQDSNDYRLDLTMDQRP